MKRHLHKLGFLLLIFIIFVLLQKFYAYHFFYIEQFQLFTNTLFYLQESWSHPGGGIEYLGNFLLQFFIVPFAGPAFATLLTAFVFLLVFLVQNRLLAEFKNTSGFFLIPVSIAVSYLLLFLDFNYYLQGNLAFVTCLLLLLFCTSIKNTSLKVGVAFIFVPALYWFAGPVSLLFAVSLFIIELNSNRFHKKQLYWGLLPIWAAIVSFWGIRFSFLESFRISFLPDLYYQRRVIPGLSIYLPWLLLIGGLVVLVLFQKSKKKSSRWIFQGIQIVVFAVVAGVGFNTLKDRRFYQIQQLDYFARNERWDDIIRTGKATAGSNALVLNYVNLALANKGLLLEQLFETKQHGIQSLKVSPENKRLIAPLLSDIDFCVGDIASSQQYAFEGNQICRGAGSGRLLQRLVETAIIFDEVKIAEKYLNLLERTWYYRKWALEQEAALVASKPNPEIEFKKRCLPPGNNREFAKDFKDQLEQLVTDNPKNEMASGYLQASYLLSKDLAKLSAFWETKPLSIQGKRNVPVACQQALLAYNETKPETWVAMGITKETVALYKGYKSFLQKHYRDKQLKALMEKQFGTTYWFYLQFS